MTRAVTGRGNTWLLLPAVSLLSTVPLPATLSAFLAILGGSVHRPRHGREENLDTLE